MYKILSGIFLIITTFVMLNQVHAELPSDVKNILHILDNDSAKVNYLNHTAFEYWKKDPELLNELSVLAAQLADSIGFTRGLAEAIKNMGMYYYLKGDIAKSLDYKLEAHALYEATNDQAGLADIRVNIGMTYFDYKDYQKAIYYYNQALAYYQEAPDPKNESITLNNIGILLEDQNKLDEAEKAYRQSLRILDSLKLDQERALLYNNLGYVSYCKGDYKTAGDYYQKGLNISTKYEDLTSTAFLISNMGGLYIITGKNDLARKLLNESFVMASQLRTPELQLKNLLYLSQLDSATNDYRTALNWYKKYTQLKDSIYFNSRSDKLYEMQVKYETREKEAENEVLKVRQLADEQRIKQQRFANLVITTLLMLSVILAIFSLSERKKLNEANKKLQQQNEMINRQSNELRNFNIELHSINQSLEERVRDRTIALRESKKELETFLYRSSHDMRGPVSTFYGLLELAKISKNPDELQLLFEKIASTLSIVDRRLAKLNIVNDILSMDIKHESIDLLEELKGVVAEYAREIEKNKIALGIEIANGVMLHSDKRLIKIIFRNLISNAIQFRGYAEPHIIISVDREDENLTISVADNGIGIDEKYNEVVFNMYTKANDQAKGDGLGLYLVKKSVERIDGKVRIKNLEKGTEFIISIPHV